MLFLLILLAMSSVFSMAMMQVVIINEDKKAEMMRLFCSIKSRG